MVNVNNLLITLDNSVFQIRTPKVILPINQIILRKL